MNRDVIILLDRFLEKRWSIWIGDEGSLFIFDDKKQKYIMQLGYSTAWVDPWVTDIIDNIYATGEIDYIYYRLRNRIILNWINNKFERPMTTMSIDSLPDHDRILTKLDKNLNTI